MFERASKTPTVDNPQSAAVTKVSVTAAFVFALFTPPKNRVRAEYGVDTSKEMMVEPVALPPRVLLSPSAVPRCVNFYLLRKNKSKLSLILRLPNIHSNFLLKLEDFGTQDFASINIGATTIRHN